MVRIRFFMIISLFVVVFASNTIISEAYASYETCSVSGCSDKRTRGSYYCYKHTCRDDGCNNKTPNGETYCSSHECKQSGCHRHRWYTSGKWTGYCEQCPWNIVESQGKKVTSTSSSTSSSKKTGSGKTSTNKKMPDCDDYDSFEDFMDDWDGKMPDGSDAEDYWENW